MSCVSWYLSVCESLQWVTVRRCFPNLIVCSLLVSRGHWAPLASQWVTTEQNRRQNWALGTNTHPFASLLHLSVSVLDTISTCHVTFCLRRLQGGDVSLHQDVLGSPAHQEMYWCTLPLQVTCRFPTEIFSNSATHLQSDLCIYKWGEKVVKLGDILRQHTHTHTDYWKKSVVEEVLRPFI